MESAHDDGGETLTKDKAHGICVRYDRRADTRNTDCSEFNRARCWGVCCRRATVPRPGWTLCPSAPRGLCAMCCRSKASRCTSTAAEPAARRAAQWAHVHVHVAPNPLNSYLRGEHSGTHTPADVSGGYHKASEKAMVPAQGGADHACKDLSLS